MSKRIQHYKREDWFTFALRVMNPYEETRERDPHCMLHVAAFGHSWWIQIPQIFKPREKWVDMSHQSWAKVGPDGRKGYTEIIQRDYGISFNREAIHVYYGIQPGCWSSNDPANSDHSRVFWWPWQLTPVRHDLLYPNGDLYHSNIFPRDRKNHLHWPGVMARSRAADSTAQVKVADIMNLSHTTRKGKVQHAKLTLQGEEREWRPKITRWLPIFRRIDRTVYCSSDIELGEKAGSWKGGLMGWSVEWRHGETMEDAVHRWYKSWDGV